jgi:hypothetical protein
MLPVFTAMEAFQRYEFILAYFSEQGLIFIPKEFAAVINV